MEIVTESLLDIVQAPIAAANNTSQSTGSIDMSGFACALFVVPITDSANTAVAELQVEASDDKATWKRLDIKKVSATSAANDDLNSKALQIEIKRPLQRYLRAKLISKTANIAFGPTLARRYAGMRTPPPGSDDALDEVVVASPAYKS